MPDDLDIFLQPPPGNEPGDIVPQEQAKDHEHAWEILRSAFDHKPKWEFCLICHERRRILPEKARVWIPPIGCARTGY